MFFAKIARWALPVLLASAASGVGAQPTTTSLGTYLICRSTPGAAACFELGMTTAARVNGTGVRNGTTGVVRVQSLQGAAVALPGGGTLAASNVITSLYEISFNTPGCFGPLPCDTRDLFGGMDFGRTINATTVARANGSVIGIVEAWQGTARKDGSSGQSQLNFSGPGINRGGNTVRQGLGGCTAGEVTATDFANLLASTAVRTCDAAGATGALDLAFETEAIFDPTYFWTANLRFYSELIGNPNPAFDRPGIADSFFCGVSSNGRGAVFRGGSGPTCSSYEIGNLPPDGTPPPVGVVPEPATVVLMSTGLIGVLVVSRRRRVGATTA